MFFAVHTKELHYLILRLILIFTNLLTPRHSPVANRSFVKEINTEVTSFTYVRLEARVRLAQTNSPLVTLTKFMPEGKNKIYSMD